MMNDLDKMIGDKFRMKGNRCIYTLKLVKGSYHMCFHEDDRTGLVHIEASAQWNFRDSSNWIPIESPFWEVS
ncbi:MAG: hypothetical protein ACRCX2_01255 [Paraclostridium sp.]